MSDNSCELFYEMSPDSVEAAYYLVKQNLLSVVGVDSDDSARSPALRPIWVKGSQLLSKHGLDVLEFTYYVFMDSVGRLLPFPNQVYTEQKVKQFMDTLPGRYEAVVTKYKHDESEYSKELLKYKSYGGPNTEADWIRIVLFLQHLTISPLFKFYIGDFHKMCDIVDKYQQDATYQYRVNRSVYRTFLCRNLLSKFDSIIDSELMYAKFR